jgi:hypothetical protein
VVHAWSAMHNWDSTYVGIIALARLSSVQQVQTAVSRRAGYRRDFAAGTVVHTPLSRQMSGVDPFRDRRVMLGGHQHQQTACSTDLPLASARGR